VGAWLERREIGTEVGAGRKEGDGWETLGWVAEGIIVGLHRLREKGRV